MEFVDNINLVEFKERYLFEKLYAKSKSFDSRSKALKFDNKFAIKYDPFGPKFRSFLTDDADPLNLTTVKLLPLVGKEIFTRSKSNNNNPDDEETIEITKFAKSEKKTYFAIDGRYDWARYIIDIVLTPIQKEVSNVDKNGKIHFSSISRLPKISSIFKMDSLSDFLVLFNDLIDGEPWLIFKNRLEELRFAYRLGLSSSETSLDDFFKISDGKPNFYNRSTSLLLDGCYSHKNGLPKRVIKYFTSSLLAQYGLLAKSSNLVDSKEMINHILHFDRSIDGFSPIFKRNHEFHTPVTMRRNGASPLDEQDASYVLFNFINSKENSGVYIKDDPRSKLGEIGIFKKVGSKDSTIRFCESLGTIKKDEDFIALGYEECIESDRCLTRFRFDSARLRNIIRNANIKRID